jgi:hypothetical protein
MPPASYDETTLGIYSYPRSGSNWLRNVFYALLSKSYQIPSEYTKDKTDETWNYLQKIVPLHPACDPESGASFETAYGKLRLFKTHSPSVVYHYGTRQLKTSFYFYVYRHPLDVFLSYLNYMFLHEDIYQRHFEIPLRPVSQLIENGSVELFMSLFIATGNMCNGSDMAGSWWKSMEYWRIMKTEYSDFVYLFKYEDLIVDPVKAFGPLRNFLPVDADILKAVAWANNMFPKDNEFFWQMRSNYYAEMLPVDLVRKFDQIHGDRLRAFGYTV